MSEHICSEMKGCSVCTKQEQITEKEYSENNKNLLKSKNKMTKTQKNIKKKYNLAKSLRRCNEKAKKRKIAVKNLRKIHNQCMTPNVQVIGILKTEQGKLKIL